MTKDHNLSPSRALHDLMEPLHEELISLIEGNPPIAGRLAGLMRKLQVLERELVTMLGTSGATGESPSLLGTTDRKRRGSFAVERAKAISEAGAWGQSAGSGGNRAYVWTTNSLCEINKGEERPRLQVNRDDYHSVAKAVASLVDENGAFSATSVHAAARRVDDSPIPMTQMYLCLRYWTAIKLIERAAGRRMKITAKLTKHKNFNQAAIDLSKPATS